MYESMDKPGVQTNKVFAEVYLLTVLNNIKKKDRNWSVKELARLLRDVPKDRLLAARSAISDFRAAGLELTALSDDIDQALRQMPGTRKS